MERSDEGPLSPRACKARPPVIPTERIDEGSPRTSRVRHQAHRVAFALAAVLALAACGYRFAVSGGPLPSGVQAVDVPVLRNQTTEPGVEGQLTDEIRHRLGELGYQGNSPERATLEAVVVAESALPLAPKVFQPLTPGAVPGYQIGNPAIYVVSLTVNAKLLRGAELLWQADNVSLQERYLPADDLATMEANRRQALHRLVQSLARELCARLTAGL